MKTKINSIALFGTSADPPTLGHEALLGELTNIFPKVITWASDNPDKKHQIPLLKRTQLLRILVKKISHPKLELVQELSSPRTINTLKKAFAFNIFIYISYVPIGRINSFAFRFLKKILMNNIRLIKK